MRPRTSEILHIRVTKPMRDQLEVRAHEQQRTVADMTRILIGYALAHMPLHTTNFGVVNPEASIRT